MTTKNKFSFRKGWRQLKQKDLNPVRQRIMDALNLKHITSFYPRLNGECEPKVSEAQAIEAVFAEYGITDIWGNE